MWPQISGILDFGDFGFWIWGFWILDLGDFGFWGFWISDFGDFGFWGFWILDFGPLCSKSLCEAPNAPNLGDFGFWGFWILGILDFGVWGFWILDFVTNFGFYIRRRRLCTPNRVGRFLHVSRFHVNRFCHPCHPWISIMSHDWIAFLICVGSCCLRRTDSFIYDAKYQTQRTWWDNE